MKILIVGASGSISRILTSKIMDSTKYKVGTELYKRHTNSLKFLKSQQDCIDFTYLRMTWLYNNSEKLKITVQKEGLPYNGTQISREAVAKFVVELMKKPQNYINESLGIVETGSEVGNIPIFYRS